MIIGAKAMASLTVEQAKNVQLCIGKSRFEIKFMALFDGSRYHIESSYCLPEIYGVEPQHSYGFLESIT